MKKVVLALLFLSQFTVFAQDFKFGKVSKEELEEQFYPLDSTADAAYLYRYRKTFFEFNQSKGGFEIITEIHNRIKIYTKEGFYKATQYIYFYNPDSGKDEKISSLKALTFNLDDNKIKKVKLSNKNIFKEKKNKYWSVKKITMPNIKKGSVIDIKYRVTSPYNYKVDYLEFQFEVPVKNLNYSVSIPEYFIFKKLTKGYFFIPPVIEAKNSSFVIKSRDRGRSDSRGSNDTKFNSTTANFKNKITKFKAKNIPALKDDEPFVNNINNYRGGIKFELKETNFIDFGGTVKYFSTDWEEVSKRIFKSSDFGLELEKSSYFKEDLQNILKTTNTDFEKVAAIFQFVKKKVKWNGFSSKYTDKGVRKAYKENVGNVADINLILTAMLRSAGLNSNPVLLSTRENGIPFFPTLEGLNYVISMVEFEKGGYILLDASEAFSLPNMLPLRALNWKGRKVTREGNSSWVNLTSSKHALEENNVMIKISETKNAIGLMITKYDNLNALNYRKNKNHIKEEDLRTQLEEKYNFEIENYKIINKNFLGKRIIRKLKFNSEDLVEEINDKLYIEPLLFLTEHNNPFKLEDRKFPIDFATPRKFKNIVSVQIPEGYMVEKLPAPLAIGLPEDLATFKYQVTQKGNKISAMSILEFNKAIIVSDYYLALKDFYGQLVKKQSEKIVLIKK